VLTVVVVVVVVMVVDGIIADIKPPTCAASIMRERP
jgi:hypothetical protein